MKAVVMCGGLGSRMRPLTEKIPKPMLKVLNRPVIERITEKLISDGFTEIYLSLGYKANDIISFFETRSYSADIHFCIEESPLGTAGGVKNCLKGCNDDFVVLSGDNIFDFDLQKIKSEHYALDGIVSIVGTNAEDPRDYGIIIRDDDGTVRHFSEKPDWENVRSCLINTGIYFCNKRVLELIPDDISFDFARDLFPQLFAMGEKIACISAKGTWYDIGGIKGYLDANAAVLSTPDATDAASDEYFITPFTDEHDNRIIPPCFIDKSVVFGGGVTVGPFCSVGANTVIGRSCTVSHSIIGNDCFIGKNTDITEAVLADNVSVHENVYIDSGSVLGFGADIGRFSRVLPDTKVNIGVRILPESIASGEICDLKLPVAELELHDMTGKLHESLSLYDVIAIGQAVASAGCIRFGIACDGSPDAFICKNVCIGGAMACGAQCFDFETAYRSQTVFYSVHCSLDAFIFIFEKDGKVSFCFTGANGLPFDSVTRRRIADNYKYKTFRYPEKDRCGELYRMELFASLYSSKLRKMFNAFSRSIELAVESSNRYLSETVNSVLSYPENAECSNRLLFITDDDGTDAYFIEDDKVFFVSSLRVFLCEYEFVRGRDVAVPEYAPEIIEKKAEKYGRKVYRMDGDITEYPDKSLIFNDIWAFDSVFLAFKLCEMAASAKMKIADMVGNTEHVIVRKNIYEFDCPPDVLHRCMDDCLGTRASDSVYYRVTKNGSKAKVRQLGNSNKIRIYSEAAEMEAAKELCSAIIDKINAGIIDIEEKK